MNDKVVARAGNSFLYHSELNENIKFSSKSDSLIKAKNFIDKWARNQLLYERSKINLSDQILNELDGLVEDYKYDLFSRSYKESVVKKSLDTFISSDEINDYYQINKSNFKLNEDLFKIRFISVPKNNIDLRKIIRKFKSFGPQDIAFLDSLSYQFTFSNLNDSIWISKREFLKSVNFIKDIDEFNFVKKSNFFQIEDSLELYLFYIKNILLRKDIPPLEYIDNTLEKIIFNKRKLKFIKKFEKDIIQDAIKTNRFEIY